MDFVDQILAGEEGQDNPPVPQDQVEGEGVQGKLNAQWFKDSYGLTDAEAQVAANYWNMIERFKVERDKYSSPDKPRFYSIANPDNAAAQARKIEQGIPSRPLPAGWPQSYVDNGKVMMWDEMLGDYNQAGAQEEQQAKYSHLRTQRSAPINDRIFEWDEGFNGENWVKISNPRLVEEEEVVPPQPEDKEVTKGGVTYTIPYEWVGKQWVLDQVAGRANYADALAARAAGIPRPPSEKYTAYGVEVPLYYRWNPQLDGGIGGWEADNDDADDRAYRLSTYNAQQAKAAPKTLPAGASEYEYDRQGNESRYNPDSGRHEPTGGYNADYDVEGRIEQERFAETSRIEQERLALQKQALQDQEAKNWEQVRRQGFWQQAPGFIGQKNWNWYGPGNVDLSTVYTQGNPPNTYDPDYRRPYLSPGAAVNAMRAQGMTLSGLMPAYFSLGDLTPQQRQEFGFGAASSGIVSAPTDYRLASHSSNPFAKLLAAGFSPRTDPLSAQDMANLRAPSWTEYTQMGGNERQQLSDLWAGYGIGEPVDDYMKRYYDTFHKAGTPTNFAPYVPPAAGAGNKNFPFAEVAASRSRRRFPF